MRPRPTPGPHFLTAAMESARTWAPPVDLFKSGRKTRRKLKVGICGEHGGEPPSVQFCHKVGTDYVSC